MCWATAGQRQPIPALFRVGAPHRAVAQVFRKLWRLQDTRTFLAMNISLTVIGLGELMFACAKPCVMTPRLYAEECGESMFWLSAAVWPVKAGLMLAGIGNPYMSLKRNMAYAMASQLGMRSSATGLLGIGRESAWAAASSKDVFEGIVEVTSATQLQSLLFVLASIAPSAAAFIFADVAAIKSPEYAAYLNNTCSDGDGGIRWQACRIAWKYKDTISISIMCCTSYAFAMVLLFRAEMWSHTFLYAVKHRNIRWLARSLRLHWFTLPLGALAGATTVLAVKIRILKASALDMVAFTWLSVAYVVLVIPIVAWSVDLDGLLYSWARALLSTNEGRNRVGPADDNATLADRHTSGAASNKSLRSFTADFSFRHRAVLIQMSIADLLVAIPFGSWTAVGIAWAGRVAGFAFLLRTKDRPCSHGELQRTEASFGLLMDADDLREALHAYLSSASYAGAIRMTRATYYRMESTLTVSYRWNSKEAEICPDLRLNMSRWQVAELLAGISETRCMYVWIDRVALPQQTCKLQTTLLARMMSIYATSRVTLALRSLESEYSRYHQRAWTLQEYCTAQRLLIKTEPRLEESTFDGLAAVADDEEPYFERVRQWHRSRADSCRPFWLWGFSLDEGGGQVTQAMYRFQELSRRVVCSYPADKIRALYPLVFNTPCEDQHELRGLLDKVAEYNLGSLSLRGSSMLLEVAQDQYIMANLAHQAAPTRTRQLVRAGAKRFGGWL